MLKRLRVGGVPEHFNYPWYLGMQENAFKEKGIDLEWVNFPGGTGAMTKALRDGEIDLATILTEGIIADILNGNPSKILQFYVKTPLRWGIHVAPHSRFRAIEDLKGAVSAISRYGSGSHLMNYVLASNMGWTDKDLRFKEIKDLNGAIEALSNGKADYFLWEHFTTKPIVDKKIFRWIADCPTPWPSFVVVASDKILESDKQKVSEVLEVVNSYTKNIKSRPGIAKSIAEKYGQKLQDIETWLKITEWEFQRSTQDEDKIKFVAEYLKKVGVIKEINSQKLKDVLEPVIT